MGIRADFRKRLTDDTTIAGLVGSRVYGVVADFKNESADHIVFQFTGWVGGTQLSGNSGVSRREVTVTCRSRDLITAEQIADAVKERCHAFTGTLGTSTNVVQVSLVGEVDGFDPPVNPEGSGDGQYAIQQTYQMIVLE